MCLRVAGKQPHYNQLLSVPGTGKILPMTIVLEAADISRFPSHGGFCQLLPHCGGNKKPATEGRKPTTTASAAIAIWGGPSSKQQISFAVMINGPSARMLESWPRATMSSRSKR
jgi:hypothetical protein